MTDTLPLTMTKSALSPRDISSFWEDGYLIFDDVFSPEEVERLRQIIEAQAVNQQYKNAQHTVHQLGLTKQDPAFLELARDSRLIDRLIPLIGQNIELHHSKLAAKPLAKGQGPFGWHQDYAYFPHTNTDLVAIMVMLDDATLENGCMSFVRGSHKLGLLNHSNASGYFTGGCVENQYWEAHPENVVPAMPRAGGISMHHCLTLHGSPPNLSGKPRRGLVIQYRAADAYALADNIWDDTGLVVAGRRSEYVRCTAGTVRLPKFYGRPGYGYGTAWNQVSEFASAVNGDKLAAEPRAR